MNATTELEIVAPVDAQLVEYAGKTGLEQTSTTPLVAAFRPVFIESRKALADSLGVAESVKDATCVSEIKKVGTQVKQGEPLMMIHYNDEAKLEQALEYFKNAYRLAPKRPTPPPLIVERVA